MRYPSPHPIDGRSELLEFFRQLSSIETLTAFEELPAVRAATPFLVPGSLWIRHRRLSETVTTGSFATDAVNKANSTRQYLIVEIRKW